jgi:hypothetical protein
VCVSSTGPDVLGGTTASTGSSIIRKRTVHTHLNDGSVRLLAAAEPCCAGPARARGRLGHASIDRDARPAPVLDRASGAASPQRACDCQCCSTSKHEVIDFCEEGTMPRGLGACVPARARLRASLDRHTAAACIRTCDPPACECSCTFKHEVIDFCEEGTMGRCRARETGSRRMHARLSTRTQQLTAPSSARGSTAGLAACVIYTAGLQHVLHIIHEHEMIGLCTCARM